MEFEHLCNAIDAVYDICRRYNCQLLLTVEGTPICVLRWAVAAVHFLLSIAHVHLLLTHKAANSTNTHHVHKLGSTYCVFLIGLCLSCSKMTCLGLPESSLPARKEDEEAPVVSYHLVAAFTTYANSCV